MNQPRNSRSPWLVAGVLLVVVWLAVEVLSIYTLGSNSRNTFVAPTKK